MTAGEATVTQSIRYSGLWCCGWSRWAMVDIRGWKLLVQQIDFIINRHVTENIETDVREINLCYTKITLGHFPRMKASSKYANTFFFSFSQQQQNCFTACRITFLPTFTPSHTSVWSDRRVHSTQPMFKMYGENHQEWKVVIHCSAFCVFLPHSPLNTKCL